VATGMATIKGQEGFVGGLRVVAIPWKVDFTIGGHNGCHHGDRHPS